MPTSLSAVVAARLRPVGASTPLAATELAVAEVFASRLLRFILCALPSSLSGSDLFLYHPDLPQPNRCLPQPRDLFWAEPARWRSALCPRPSVPLSLRACDLWAHRRPSLPQSLLLRKCLLPGCFASFSALFPLLSQGLTSFCIIPTFCNRTVAFLSPGT